MFRSSCRGQESRVGVSKREAEASHHKIMGLPRNAIVIAEQELEDAE